MTGEEYIELFKEGIERQLEKSLPNQPVMKLRILTLASMAYSQLISKHLEGISHALVSQADPDSR